VFINPTIGTVSSNSVVMNPAKPIALKWRLPATMMATPSPIQMAAQTSSADSWSMGCWKKMPVPSAIRIMPNGQVLVVFQLTE